MTRQGHFSKAMESSFTKGHPSSHSSESLGSQTLIMRPAAPRSLDQLRTELGLRLTNDVFNQHPTSHSVSPTTSTSSESLSAVVRAISQLPQYVPPRRDMQRIAGRTPGTCDTCRSVTLPASSPSSHIVQTECPNSTTAPPAVISPSSRTLAPLPRPSSRRPTVAALSH